jgi:hypothetical protein
MTSEQLAEQLGSEMIYVLGLAFLEFLFAYYK